MYVELIKLLLESFWELFSLFWEPFPVFWELIGELISELNGELFSIVCPINNISSLFFAYR